MLRPALREFWDLSISATLPGRCGLSDRFPVRRTPKMTSGYGATSAYSILPPARTSCCRDIDSSRARPSECKPPYVSGPHARIRDWRTPPWDTEDASFDAYRHLKRPNLAPLC